jgi:hypothetical protein
MKGSASLVRSLRSLSPFGRVSWSGFAAPSLWAAASKLACAAGEGTTAPSRTPDGVVGGHVSRPDLAASSPQGLRFWGVA